jgi:hypothetical protein
VGLFYLELEETCIFCDNQQKREVKLQYISTEEYVANVLTKPLFRVKFEYFRDKIGVVQKDFSTGEK